jgi:type II secretory pathway pseudopilin PulG
MNENRLSRVRDIAVILAALAVFALATSGALYVWSLRQTHVRQEAEAIAEKAAAKDAQEKKAAANRQASHDFLATAQEWADLKTFAQKIRESNLPDSSVDAQRIDDGTTAEQTMYFGWTQQGADYTTARLALIEERKNSSFQKIIDQMHEMMPTTKPSN